MFLDFYRLQEQPFGVTPDPAYLYASRTHSDTLSSLTLGLKHNRGFLALVAEPGMGKTTLLYQLLDDLRDAARTVLVSQTLCNPHEFIELILHDLGINTDALGRVAMHGKLNEALFREMLLGKRFVLIVDEAQNLDESVLETIRMLSNFETHNTKLLQIILAGQPQLATKLSLPRLSQLRQRIAVFAHLEPFHADEIGLYIAHRLKVAGYKGEPLFDHAAIRSVAQYSHGIPRSINSICYDSLTLAASRGQLAVSQAIVEEAADRLDVRLFTSSHSAPSDIEVAVAAAAGAGAVKATEHKPALSVAAMPPKGPEAKSKSQLTYAGGAQANSSKWPLRLAILAVILVSATSLPAILHYSGAKQDNAAAAVRNPVDSQGAQSQPDSADSKVANYDAAPQETGAGQVLTVMAGPQQTLKALSLRYVGHFDDDLSKEIISLNPDLKDPDHLEEGQLIRLPLPAGAMKKANDTGEIENPPKSAQPENLFTRFVAFLRDRK